MTLEHKTIKFIKKNEVGAVTEARSWWTYGLRWGVINPFISVQQRILSNHHISSCLILIFVIMTSSNILLLHSAFVFCPSLSAVSTWPTQTRGCQWQMLTLKGNREGLRREVAQKICIHDQVLNYGRCSISIRIREIQVKTLRYHWDTISHLTGGVIETLEVWHHIFCSISVRIQSLMSLTETRSNTTPVHRKLACLTKRC